MIAAGCCEGAAESHQQQIVDLGAIGMMRGAEQLAAECGRTLLVLDTATGSDAERLYARLGWQRVGVIPGYSLMPQEGMCDTTYFYRRL